MIRISPPEKLTEFFGLFALSGKVTSFAGPVLVASLTALSGSQQVCISVMVAFLVVALWAMAPVRVAGPAPAP